MHEEVSPKEPDINSTKCYKVTSGGFGTWRIQQILLIWFQVRSRQLNLNFPRVPRARADVLPRSDTASSDHTARLWELASGTTVRQVSLNPFRSLRVRTRRSYIRGRSNTDDRYDTSLTVLGSS
jgi:hypothetical protein